MNIKCVHLLSNPLDLRERRSIYQIRRLPSYGIPMTPIVNKPWVGPVPPGRADSERPFKLAQGRYGCWKAHKDAITGHLVDVDALLVCECDCLPIVRMDEFVKRVSRAASACAEGNLDAFTLGYRHGGKTVDRIGSDVIVIDQWVETHCYVVPIKSRQLFLDMFEQPWDTYDYCTSFYLCGQGHRVGAFADRPVAIQADGLSLLDGKVKTTENHIRRQRH